MDNNKNHEDNLGSRELGVGSSEENSPTPHSLLPTPSPSPNEQFTPDEMAQMTGYQPERVQLIDREYMLERDSETTEPRENSENPLVRFAIASLLVGGILSAGWLIWSIFFAVKSPAPKIAATPTPAVKPETPTNDEAAKLKAELAFRNQMGRQQQANLPAPTPAPAATPTPTKPETANPKPTPSPQVVYRDRVVREPAPTPKIVYRDRVVREPAPPPKIVYRDRVVKQPAPPPKVIKEPAPPPRVIREKVPVPQPQIAAVPSPQPKTPEVDPFERWNQLATVGQQATDAEVASVPPTETVSQTAVAALPDNEQVPQLNSISKEQTKPTSIPTITIGDSASIAAAPTDSSYPTEEDRGIEDTPQFALTEEDTKRDVEPPSKEEETDNPSDFQIVTASSAPASECLNNSPSNSECNLESTQSPTPGELGILNRTPISETNGEIAVASNLPMQVQIGTSAKAKVLVPMIWSEENQANRGRFAVQLEEDVLSTDNRVALPKGTILITEVDSVTPDNKLVNQSAVAVVYPDTSGEVRQQSIPKESILIRGKNGEPLIAKAMRDKGGEIARQDILIGLLGVAGRAGEVINQNQNQSSTIISSGGFSSQTITTSARRPDIFAAAVEGFFKPMSQRLSQRSDRTTQEILNRSNVAIIPQGTKVSVFFNTFFVVNR